MADGFFKRWLGRADGTAAVRPLYQSIVAKARDLHWYVEGGVADTIDGRFEMIAAIFSLVMIRLEALGDPAKVDVAMLTEVFVEDMDGQLRELGFGDVGLGKRVGEMVSALGGRLGAYRDGLAGVGDFEAALVRNLYREQAPAAPALAFTAAKLRADGGVIGTLSLETLRAGQL
ncbi:MAG: ubiquinol-cytochrome C chaperone family protein [Sphingomonadaceae bacterium]